MTDKIQVLIVEDSIAVQKIITSIIQENSSIQIIGYAENMHDAIEKTHHMNPDVILLDIELNASNGIDVLKQIRSEQNRAAIIMCSTATLPGARATIDALLLGADDYISKPTNLNSSSESIALLKKEILDKIISLGPKRRNQTHQIAKISTTSSQASFVASTNKPISIIVIGSSTGGPAALEILMTKMPKNIPVPIAIVQHMPPVYTKMLAERLQKITGLHIQEAYQGESIEPSQIWIAPGNHHLVLKRSGSSVTLSINQEEPENFCRPSVNALFRSAASIYGEATLGVILTGMGEDGTIGCSKIMNHGGSIIVQNEETSAVWGMPGSVVKNGLADSILPLSDIASEIIKRLQRAYPKWTPEF